MSTPLPPASIWTVLQDKPFRGMWGASFGYFTANSMMAMAAAWMMVELQASAFVVALVQTAVFLPMFVLALPAGVVADTTDRRRLLLTTLVVQALGVAVLSMALLGGLAGPATVLFFTLLFGCCTAVLTPAWNSMVGDPDRYVERFIVASWADYLHQRARTTVADRELEDQLLGFLQPGTSVVLQHYIAER